MNEPFLPITHTGSDEIDAADPGLGAPGTPTPPTTDIEDAEREFEDRIEQARGQQQIFRTPEPAPGPPTSD
ncbi:MULTISPECIES: hypothetical protein [unclassified Rhodococcus (in: high G+C Gram-positive bacteria)]|uniref:hypothetical protein n=1 Tax=unclassified Rhodococcus (in: high G+C Gram-positive bacteria) TaxID=192944 RepID=UPI001BB2EFD1|nr:MULTISPECIES: hypothetical protein [unclassified Rhodococcus (in: high G+C Gram-positive bacteria)]